jgi:hypothetical protein
VLIILNQIRLVLTNVLFWIVDKFTHLSGKYRRRRVISKMQKGDVILASPKTLRLSPIALIYRILLRSQYVHSMLYIGNSKMIHTTSKYGVIIDNIPRKIYQKDRYTILRVHNLSDSQREHIVGEALKYRHKKLDHAGLITNIPSRFFGFNKPLLRFEKNRLWCSKLIYKVYSSQNIELVSSANMDNITSEDLSQSKILQKI